MTVEIPSDFQQFVHSVIDAGSYKNETEVVGEALRLLQDRQQRIEEFEAKFSRRWINSTEARGSKSKMRRNCGSSLRTSKNADGSDWRRSRADHDAVPDRISRTR